VYVMQYKESAGDVCKSCTHDWRNTSRVAKSLGCEKAINC